MKIIVVTRGKHIYPYTANGKELDRHSGLDWYGYARGGMMVFDSTR